MRWVGGLLLAVCLVGAAEAQQVNLYCNNGATGPSAWQPCVSSNPLAVNASVSASVSGFTPSTSGARATPLTVTTSDSSGTLPTGAVVIVSNVGSNPMYCNVNGAAATTSDQPIASGVGNWFAFTIPVGVTTLHCIATGGSTTANMLGGSGLATGSGGGGGGVASTVTANQGTATGGTAWPVSLASVPLPSGAATSANQATEISSLATIAANTGNPIPSCTGSPCTTIIGVASNDPCAYGVKTTVPIGTSSGNLQLVAGVSAKKVYICSFALIAAATAVVNLIEGTGAACTTANEAAVFGSTTAASGASLAANGGLTLGNGGGTIGVTATATNGICLLQSGTTALAGNITYVQQ